MEKMLSIQTTIMESMVLYTKLIIMLLASVDQVGQMYLAKLEEPLKTGQQLAF